MSRLHQLWEQVRRTEIEIPEFVYDHDDDLGHHPVIDYGLESDHPRASYGSPALVDSTTISTFSSRCIS